MSEWGDTAYLGLLPPAAWPPCLCSVGHWASGRLLGGTWPAAAAATCSTNTTVVLGYWQGSRCWAWGGVQQPGTCAPRHAAQLRDDPDSEQRLDIRDVEWFVYWLESPGDVCGLFCCWRPCWCLWSMLLPEAQLKFVVGADSGDHAAHLDCCLWEPGWCPWSLLRPQTTWKSMIHAAAGCYKQGNLFCNNIDDFRFITENERHKASVLTPPSKETNNAPPHPQKTVQMESY